MVGKSAGIPPEFRGIPDSGPFLQYGTKKTNVIANIIVNFTDKDVMLASMSHAGKHDSCLSCKKNIYSYVFSIFTVY